jgi:hypothetical protein
MAEDATHTRPEWFGIEPEVSCDLSVHLNGSLDQHVDLSRHEYIALKKCLATMRGLDPDAIQSAAETCDKLPVQELLLKVSAEEPASEPEKKERVLTSYLMTDIENRALRLQSYCCTVHSLMMSDRSALDRDDTIGDLMAQGAEETVGLIDVLYGRPVKPRPRS